MGAKTSPLRRPGFGKAVPVTGAGSGAAASPVSPKSNQPSGWEWLPVAAVPFLLILHMTHGKGLERYTDFAVSPYFFLIAGLVPGAIWRLAGRRSWGVHRLGFAAALAGIALSNPDLRPDAAVWRRVLENWRLVALGFASSFAQPIWGAFRLHRLLGDGGEAGTWLKTFRLCLIGSFFNVILPGSTGGDAYRAYALGRGSRLGSAIAAVSLDRLLGLPPLIFLLLAAMAWEREFLAASRVMVRTIPFIISAGAVSLALAGYLLLAGKSRRRADAESIADGAPPGRWRRLHLLISGNVRRRGTIPLTMAYGLLAHVNMIVACILFGEALGVSGLSWTRYFLVVPMAMAVNAIPGSPGGAGQGELAMAALLEMANPDVGNAQAGVALMLLFRLSNLGIGLAGAAAYALGGNRASPGPDGKPPWP